MAVIVLLVVVAVGWYLAGHLKRATKIAELQGRASDAVTFTRQELAAITALAKECATEFYAVTVDEGRPQGLALWALVRAALDCRNEEATSIMDEIEVEYQALTKEERGLIDPLLLALTKITHAKCLDGRVLTGGDRKKLFRQCLEALAQVEQGRRERDSAHA
jgi:hypothetical protein